MRETPVDDEPKSPTEPERLDLRGIRCPENSGRAVLAMEWMEPGERLELLIDDGEPCERVPITLQWEGHQILEMEPVGEYWRLLVSRGEDG